MIAFKSVPTLICAQLRKATTTGFEASAMVVRRYAVPLFGMCDMSQDIHGQCSSTFRQNDLHTGRNEGEWRLYYEIGI